MPDTISVKPSGSARATVRLGADEPAATDAVLDVELLAEARGERLGVEPADRVGRAAGREWHHQPHRLGRPFGSKSAGG